MVFRGQRLLTVGVVWLFAATSHQDMVTIEDIVTEVHKEAVRALLRRMKQIHDFYEVSLDGGDCHVIP